MIRPHTLYTSTRWFAARIVLSLSFPHFSRGKAPRFLFRLRASGCFFDSISVFCLFDYQNRFFWKGKFEDSDSTRKAVEDVILHACGLTDAWYPHALRGNGDVCGCENYGVWLSRVNT